MRVLMEFYAKAGRPTVCHTRRGLVTDTPHHPTPPTWALGILCYFHFTNNLRTGVQDAGSGGAVERARFPNRETDTSPSLEGDQVYISEGDPCQMGGREEHFGEQGSLTVMMMMMMMMMMTCGTLAVQ
ncbi:unnamed protein product [Pleuronectes platessa]|uniref:Uncharacterized protein n=1 Tax=Pleuronectes platessa TaxID=8262 RepID=A0A9N7TWP5_PLEPL|nr:unnamed protein product [Pleuronectes platessa]